MPQFLNTSDTDFEAQFQALLSAKREDSPDVDAIVADIIADVRGRGDAAVLDLTAKFDRLELAAGGLAFSEAEIDAEIAKVPDEERDALELAAERIRIYHEAQMPEDHEWEEPNGAML
ncbi:MAG: histidinol dehydrogenase, partial [Paracoccaceae bacterium]|nr:histidinol dehydrogenase [Paracoccaceae bacterium]